MLVQDEMERAYYLGIESTGYLKEALETSYLEAYLENAENILDDYKVRVLAGVPDELTVHKVEKIYQEMQGLSLTKEDVRKVLQLVLLKVAMEDKLQPNHQLTPDSIGFLLVFMLETLLPKLPNKKVTLLDPAVGMGNLLYTILTNLELAGYKTASIGVDIDELLLEVAAVNGQLLKEDTVLYHQDAMQPLLVDPVDVVVSDLPVGYYPIDEVAKDFQVAAQEGHTYAHHLLIEKSLMHLQPAGIGLFVVPSNLLESPQTPLFTQWLTENAYLQAFIHLPETLFKSKQARKSLLVLQKQGGGSQQAKKVLLAELTNLKEVSAIQKFFREFNDWKVQNLK